jgi:hypothetical protein
MKIYWRKAIGKRLKMIGNCFIEAVQKDGFSIL